MFDIVRGTLTGEAGRLATIVALPDIRFPSTARPQDPWPVMSSVGMA